jgi:cbb3-type cytochrome oxidase maturation protein
MNGLPLIIASALAIGLCALVVLLWALASGQYDDPEGDAARILIDEDDACYEPANIKTTSDLE